MTPIWLVYVLVMDIGSPPKRERCREHPMQGGSMTRILRVCGAGVSPRLALSALAMAALSMTQPVFGQDHQLVMTENSPTSLTVLYDGSGAGITVVPGSADSWLVTFPTTTHLGFELDWQEPGNPNQVNDFNIYNPDIGISNTWLVSSEFVLPGGASQDSAQPPDGFKFVSIGGDTRDNLPIDATFHDLAGTAAVPEPDTWAMAAAGTALLVAFHRRQKKIKG